MPNLVLAAPEAEVVHWWQSASERQALGVFLEAFQAEGGEWFDVSTDTYNSTRESALKRMAKGYSPTAVQWNGGTCLLYTSPSPRDS